MARTNVTYALKAIFDADATVTGIVGTKHYAGRALQETGLPYIVFDIVSNEPTNEKDGASPVDAVRVQVDCYAATYLGVEVLNDAVRDALDAYPTATTIGGVKIDGILYITENGAIEEDTDIYRRSSDYQVRIKY